MNQFGIIATIAALAWTWSANAATVGVQTNNINDPVNHPYAQWLANSQCPTGQCQLQFPATTAPQTLIQHISCEAFLTPGATLVDAVIASAYNNDTEYLTANSVPDSDGGTQVTINENVYVFATKGGGYFFYLDPSAGGSVEAMACTIAGYHN